MTPRRIFRRPRAAPALDPATFVRRLAQKAGTPYGEQLTGDVFALIERSGDPEPWMREVQRARDAGSLPRDVAWFLLYKFVDSAMSECVSTDPELVAHSARIEEIERAAGLTDEEYFRIGEGPPEWEQATKEWDVIYQARCAEFFRRVGEEALATESTSGEVDPLFAAGRAAIFVSIEDPGE